VDKVGLCRWWNVPQEERVMATQFQQKFNVVDLIVSDIDRSLERLRQSKSEEVTSLAEELQSVIDAIRHTVREI
jgi:hypothetical protein